MFLIIFAIFLFLVAFYNYATKNFNYWAKRNVKYLPPVPIFGNHLPNIIGQKSFTEYTRELYNKFPDEKVVGYYRCRTPELIIRDPEIAKHILSIDFVNFYERGLGRNADVEPLLANLFHAEGDLWKQLRQRLTAAFTTAKLKSMFPLIVECAEKLHVVGEDIISRGGECDVRDLMARFTIEFIGACGFGVQMDSINNEQSRFKKLAQLIFKTSRRRMVKLALYEIIPAFRSFLHVSEPEIEKGLEEILATIREQRNFKPSSRHDFIDLLMELEQKGKLSCESIEKTNPDGTPAIVEREMTFKLMCAQVFIFLAAGFETSSSATSWTLHQLAFYPEIQEKIQQEIDEVLSKYDDKLCYNSISEMNLLDMAFKESMRILPSLGVLNRVCTRQYTIPKVNITIDPGVKVVIPIQAYHMDKQYFENPEVFDPERFSSDNVKNINKYVYLPFGEGPRNCVGSRLGHMQSLAGLAAILQKFSVEPSESTVRQPELNHFSNVVQGITKGLPLRLKLRKPKVL